MYTHTGYMNGTNLGHWLSQYGDKSDEHFSTYITEPDIKKIAEFGFDHVRLPVDHCLFEDDNNPFIYNPVRVQYIDNVINWCEKYGLNLILDLHRAPGFNFFDFNDMTLFQDKKMQDRYLAIWRFFSYRYEDKKNVAFELLNELILDDIELWNDLWQRTVEVIHTITPWRDVIVGGDQYNSVNGMEHLTISDNPHIFYTFHYYLPMLFTHQRCGWLDDMRAYRTPVEYPFDGRDHAAFWGENGVPEDMARMIDKEYLREHLKPAFDFIEKNHRPLYCGEFGVNHQVDIPSQKRWYIDLLDLLHEAGIGHAVWSWRGFASVTDENNNVTDPELVKILSRV